MVSCEAGLAAPTMALYCLGLVDALSKQRMPQHAGRATHVFLAAAAAAAACAAPIMHLPCRLQLQQLPQVVVQVQKVRPAGGRLVTGGCGRASRRPGGGVPAGSCRWQEVGQASSSAAAAAGYKPLVCKDTYVSHQKLA
jgi:hypothetical protein